MIFHTTIRSHYMRIKLLTGILIISTLISSAQSPDKNHSNHVKSVNGILHELLEIISAEKGEVRDLEALRNLFLPEATFSVLSAGPDSARHLETVNLDDFMESLQDEYYENGFEERELGKVVHEFNGIASVFQSFYGKDSEGNELRGINSFQLVFMNGRWWIAHTIWTFETEDVKIPSQYLNNHLVADHGTDAFKKRNINGCMVLHDMNHSKSYFYNKARCDSSYLPASTFKVINSLISLEEGAVESIYDTIKWDGKDRNWEKWNQDHCLESALKYSAVWFYQELARRVGRENYQKWLDKIDYGNRKTGEETDTFWLNGDIRISANEQIKFLEKLIRNELPFDKKNQELVKQIMLTDSTEKYQLHSKTGWAMRVDKQIGWLIGFVVTEENVWIFACNIDIKKDADARYRKEIVYEILKTEGII